MSFLFSCDSWGAPDPDQKHMKARLRSIIPIPSLFSRCLARCVFIISLFFTESTRYRSQLASYKSAATFSISYTPESLKRSARENDLFLHNVLALSLLSLARIICTSLIVSFESSSSLPLFFFSRFINCDAMLCTRLIFNNPRLSAPLFFPLLESLRFFIETFPSHFSPFLLLALSRARMCIIIDPRSTSGRRDQWSWLAERSSRASLFEFIYLDYYSLLCALSSSHNDFHVIFLLYMSTLKYWINIGNRSEENCSESSRNCDFSNFIL